MAFNPASLDTRAKSEEGVWLTLTDVDGNEIFDGDQPVQLKIIGKDSALAKEALTELQRTDNEPEFVAMFIKGWSKNVDAKDAMELAVVPSIRDFIIKAVLNRANFTK